MHELFDVLIIGGGVVGSAVARELSRFSLRIGVLEKEPDICCGNSIRNSGVLHAGINSKPGSKMAKYCVEGNKGFDQIAQELDVPYRRTGKLVVGFTSDDEKKLLEMLEIGRKNGIEGLEIVGKERIQELAPYIKGEFALWSPTTAILNPFQYTIGLMENAVENGAQCFLNHEVTGIEYICGNYQISTSGGIYKCRWVINCAGLGAAHISTMLGIDEYTLYPCRGEYFIMDKNIGHLLPLPVYPVPNPKEGGLGIHLTPTMEGNILVGPSAEYIDFPDDYSATQDVMDVLLSDGARIFPYLKRESFIRNFSGIRPKLTGEGGYADFIIERRDSIPQAINLVGIESPGLTSSIPLAREVIRLIEEVEILKPNSFFNPFRKRVETFADKTPEERQALIRHNPDYGEIICRCETITRAEVLAAIHNPLGVDTITGIKYRCRTMMGRCQGGYCQTRIAELIMQEKQKKREQLQYHREGSYCFTGKVRE